MPNAVGEKEARSRLQAAREDVLSLTWVQAFLNGAQQRDSFIGPLMRSVASADGSPGVLRLQVAERVRDAYRIAWGMPWVKTVMAATPNAMLAFTPLVSCPCADGVMLPLSYSLTRDASGMRIYLGRRRVVQFDSEQRRESTSEPRAESREAVGFSDAAWQSSSEFSKKATHFVEIEDGNRPEFSV